MERNTVGNLALPFSSCFRLGQLRARHFTHLIPELAPYQKLCSPYHGRLSPSLHPRGATPSDPSSMSPTSTVPDSGIAIIDFAPFLNGSNKREVANAMLESFKDIGFVYLLNHGIPQERVTQMFGMVRSDLPLG